jgi:hypothetical protein
MDAIKVRALNNLYQTCKDIKEHPETTRLQIIKQVEDLSKLDEIVKQPKIMIRAYEPVYIEPKRVPIIQNETSEFFISIAIFLGPLLFMFGIGGIIVLMSFLT